MQPIQRRLEVGDLGPRLRGNSARGEGILRFGLTGEKAERLLDLEEGGVQEGLDLRGGGPRQYVEVAYEAQLERGIRDGLDLAEVRGFAE